MNSVFSLLSTSFLLTFCLLSSCKSAPHSTPSAKKAKSTVAQTPSSAIPSAKSLKLNIVHEPQHLDPRRARSLNEMNLTKMLMEGLTRIGKNEEVLLAQAESIHTSEDNLTYTVALKETYWSNGDRVTAQDFAYAWKKVLSPDFIAENAYQLFIIKNAKEIKNGGIPNSLLGVTCVDDKTLVIELESAVPYFTQLLAMPVFFPVNQRVDRRNPHWASSQETYVGNGPFQLQSWSHHQQLVAVKNPQYWDREKVKVGLIDMVMVAEDTGIKLFENENLDWEGSPFSALPVDALPSIKQSGKWHETQALATYFVAVNTKKKS